MAKFKHGKRGRVQIGGNTFKALGWSASIEIDSEEVTNTESGGAKEYISGLLGGSGSIDAVWDLEDPLTNKYANISRGEHGAVILYIGDPSGENDIVSGTIQVTNFEITSATDSRVEVTLDFVFTGAPTLPT